MCRNVFTAENKEKIKRSVLKNKYVISFVVMFAFLFIMFLSIRPSPFILFETDHAVLIKNKSDTPFYVGWALVASALLSVLFFCLLHFVFTDDGEKRNKE